MTISDEKQYEYIGSVITDRLNRVRDAFKLFLQLFSAIVGGSIWLSMQPGLSQDAKQNYTFVSNLAVWLVIFVTGTMVLEALRGWWGYRKKLSEFDGGNYPIPTPRIRAVAAEFAVILFMLSAGLVFTESNPFRYAVIAPPVPLPASGR